MYPYRGRTGPSKATPSNVQCQKCLKRDKCSDYRSLVLLLTVLERHYSYECKAGPQERPYIPRPSRTQQLFNPKLLPKLASETPNALQETCVAAFVYTPDFSLTCAHRKGVADEELAKREAERARKREREMDEEADLRSPTPSRRGRSPSYDSVSSISTRSPSPAPRRSRSRSVSPQPREKRRVRRSPSPRGSPIRGRSYDTGRRYSRSPSRSQEREYPSRDSRAPRSPLPRRSLSPQRDYGSPEQYDRRRVSYTRRTYSRSRSRSPVNLDDTARKHRARGYRDREERGPRGNSPPPRPPQRPSPPRERSLSPFSRRLALTQAMNKGR